MIKMMMMMMIMMLKLQFCANEVNKSDRKKIESAVLGHIIDNTQTVCLCIDLKY